MTLVSELSNFPLQALNVHLFSCEVEENRTRVASVGHG